jgi:hypothetical protein
LPAAPPVWGENIFKTIFADFPRRPAKVLVKLPKQ